MAKGELKLTLNKTIGDPSPYTVTLGNCANPFLGDAIPRIVKRFVDGITYTVSGNSIDSGTSFSTKHFWDIRATVSVDTATTIQRIYEYGEFLKRSQLSRILLIDDETELYFEAAKTTLTKTKPSVTGTSAINVNGGVEYYAQFNAFMVVPPVFGVISAGYRSVVLTLEEA